MLPIYFFNGKQYTSSESIADIRDRGLAYGDGVFETILTVEGKIPFWPQHKARLLKGLDHLGIKLSEEQFEHHCVGVFNQLKTIRDHCVVKLIVTRGVSNRGYIPTGSSPNIIAIITPFIASDLSKKGCSVHQCKEVLPEPVSWAGLKTLNQLSYVLASAERVDTIFDEGLILSSQGHIIEATARNIFCIRDNILHTPDLTGCGVAGVMREMIINQFAPFLQVDVKVGRLTISDLLATDEVFLCNSITGLWPIIHFDDVNGCHDWPIGEVTLKLQDLLEDFIKSS